MPCLTYEWEEAEIEGSDKLFFVELEVDFGWTAGHPGYISGPPENCYPPEPDECEIHSVSVLKVLEIDEDGNEKELEITDEVHKLWDDKFMAEVADDEDFYERMCEEGRDAEEAAYEAAQEARMDEMRELNWL